MGAPFFNAQDGAGATSALRRSILVRICPNSRLGTGKGEEPKVELSKLIDKLNERFGTEFTEADELFFHQVREDAMADEAVRQAAQANTIDNFRYVFDKSIEGIVIDRLEQNESIAVKLR